jgi:phage shock protein C
MYCNWCGKVIQDDANVCAYCARTVGALQPPKKMLRPKHGRKIGGVAAGMAEYWNIDVTVVRLVWVLVGLMAFPLGIIGYIIAWIVIPEEQECADVPAASPGVAHTA